MFGFSQRTSLTLWVMLSFMASAGGLAYAVFWGGACDGGRGGAVAVAIAFGILFAARPLAQDYIEARDNEGVARFDGLPVDKRISRLRSALAVLLDRQQHETASLAFASITGTLVWGFGDWIAGALGASAC